jgi:uncharacterized membrane protein YjjP (DUF1212 family)
MTSDPRSTHAHGGQDPNLTAFIILTVLVPIIGIVTGIVYLFRNEVGPGLGLLAIAIFLTLAYSAILATLL